VADANVRELADISDRPIVRALSVRSRTGRICLRSRGRWIALRSPDTHQRAADRRVWCMRAGHPRPDLRPPAFRPSPRTQQSRPCGNWPGAGCCDGPGRLAV